jgi:hypothetical protein
MLGLGVPPEIVSAIVARRPYLSADDYTQSLPPAATGGLLRFGGNSIFTLRATARLRTATGELSDLRRTVSATIDFQQKKDPPVVILRWYDRA